MADDGYRSADPMVVLAACEAAYTERRFNCLAAALVGRIEQAAMPQADRTLAAAIRDRAMTNSEPPIRRIRYIPSATETRVTRTLHQLQLSSFSPTPNLTHNDMGIDGLRNAIRNFGDRRAMMVVGPAPRHVSVVRERPWEGEYRGVFNSELAEIADMVRCVLPPRELPFDSTWLTTPVRGLAASMVEADDYRAMPVLADAMQEAGCEVEIILSHCRDNTPHVRGCWVIDGILQKD